MVISIENPELEHKKRMLTDQIAQDKLKLKEIENEILKLVSN